ncbi:MAG TPA: hypothetical protein VLI04_04455 [Nocardioidaceae bacterium]|nr:hypothetical protein [Nocardioidaceae bacterium]
MRARLLGVVLVSLAISGCTGDGDNDPAGPSTETADACAGFTAEVGVTSAKSRIDISYQGSYTLPPASSGERDLHPLHDYTASVRRPSGEADADLASEVLDQAEDRAGTALAAVGEITPSAVPFPRTIRNDTDFNLSYALFLPVRVWSGSWRASTCDASTGQQGQVTGRWTSWRLLRPQAVPCGSRPRSALAAEQQRVVCA